MIKVDRIKMNIERLDTEIKDLILLAPKVFGDERGYFLESFHSDKYRDLGINENFVQDNLSKSTRGVLRGLHYQWPFSQGKLLMVLEGSVYDVAVDIRPASKTYGKWEGFQLNSKDKTQLYVPPGFAHGFVVLSEEATFF